MNVIAFASSLLGILFVIRTLRIFRARALLTASFLTKAGTIFVFTPLACAFFAGDRLGLAISLALLNAIAAWIALFSCERREIGILREEVPYFLDRWILNLRLGSAPLIARERALEEHSERFCRLLRPIFSSGGLSAAKPHHPLLPTKYLLELERVLREPHAARARLENLRRNWRKSSEFRRKSGQATQQTRIQASLMLFMLLALVIFTLRRYGWARAGDLTVEAVLLSMLGMVTMFVLSRKRRWKI